MAKTCIICGNRAGSGEHTFPAALGGRRTNRGIYCNPHDRGFSPLVKQITAQLKPINYLLSVRPDHQKQAEPFIYESPNGEQLVIFDGVVKRADPAEARNENKLHVQLTLGGPEGLRAIAYIATTFFAQHFQEHARKDGLQPLKEFITTEADNNFVWWEDNAILEALPQNAFDFGHTIALTTSAGTGRATALVSLFQSLTFGIDLGPVDGLSDQSVVVFINPLADRAPDDLQTSKFDHVLLKLSKPEPLHLHLERAIKSRSGQQKMQALLNKIQRWKFDKDMIPYLDRLNATAGMAPVDTLRQMESFVEEQTGRVYRLMKHVVGDFKEGHGDDPVFAPLIKSLDAMVELKPDSDEATEVAEVAISRCMIAILKDLAQHRGEFNTAYLWDLFNTGHGLGIVGEELFKHAGEQHP